MAKVEQTPNCWLWTGYVMPNGYGTFHYQGRPELAHRVAYQLFIGPIPEGLTVDHVKDRGCTQRHCVRPEHLEAVTLMENRQRGHRTNQHASKTECVNGHPFDEANTKIRSDGARECRTCRRAISQRSNERRRKNVHQG